MNTGIVYLVGAGPGDPDLITVKGLRCLQHADTVVYDRLANPALIDEAPPTAGRIFAGKAPGHHTLTQTQINHLLVDEARQGKTVVRLKGGDPFVFGRGGEEALACALAGVRWEVVPGISSAIAVPASAGIPVTHRGVAGSFAVVSAVSKDGKDTLNWEALAQLDTLVVLMGVERLPYVVTMLERAGRSSNTPIAIIERGTTPDERAITGTLADIVEASHTAAIQSPATIVVGEVVKLRELLISAESKETYKLIYTNN
jgi:uroporphyrin-III C-methyltransferase